MRRSDNVPVLHAPLAPLRALRSGHWTWLQSTGGGVAEGAACSSGATSRRPRGISEDLRRDLSQISEDAEGGGEGEDEEKNAAQDEDACNHVWRRLQPCVLRVRATLHPCACCVCCVYCAQERHLERHLEGHCDGSMVGNMRGNVRGAVMGMREATTL